MPDSLPPGLADHPLWRFSLALYGAPGVAEACLGLQDRHGADVNVVLLILWRAVQGREVPEPAMKAVLAVSRDWQAQVVGPVRAARRSARRAMAASPAAADLYPRLKQAELACEHAEQMALAALLPQDAATGGGARADGRLAEIGLRAYMASLPGAPPEAEEEWLAVLVNAALTLPAAAWHPPPA